MRKFIKKVWHDPVGSNVIGAVIFTLLTTIVFKVISFITKIPFTDLLSKVLNYTITIKVDLLILLVIFFLLIIVFIRNIRKRSLREKDFSSNGTLIDEICETHEFRIDYIMWKFDTSIKDNKVKLSNLIPYCIRHEPRLIMEEQGEGRYVCIHPECNHEIYRISGLDYFFNAEKVITSVLQEKLDDYRRSQRDLMKRITNYNN